MNYARAIKICRAAFEMEQQELADSVGVTPSYLSLIESGKRKPSNKRFEEICEVFGIPLDLMVLLGAEPGELEETDFKNLGEISRSLLEVLVFNKRVKDV